MSFLDTPTLCIPYIKSSTWHHNSNFLATFLEMKKLCRSYYKRGKTTHIMSQAKNGRGSWRNISSLTDVLILPILMAGGLKPEYYICKRIFFNFNFWPSSKQLKNDPYRLPPFLLKVKCILIINHSSTFISDTKKTFENYFASLRVLWFKLTDQSYLRIRLKSCYSFQPYSRTIHKISYNKAPKSSTHSLDSRFLALVCINRRPLECCLDTVTWIHVEWAKRV